MDKNQSFNKVVLFQEKTIRRAWYKEEWWFVVQDVVAVLTDSKDPKNYLRNIRRRDEALAAIWEALTDKVSIETSGGKQKLVCSTTKGLFRIIQSIPSKKAEPFKLWLAQVGHERIQEIENPELAAKRARQLYKEKGYSDEWIDSRMKAIEIREQLTDEWKNRGIDEGKEYSILTGEISKATFGLLPSEHKEHKGLKKENLRDHMTNLELIFTMLGEEVTRKIVTNEDSQGFDENKEAAIKGGTIAGNARKETEELTGEKVVSSQNFKKQIEQSKTKQQELDFEEGDQENE